MFKILSFFGSYFFKTIFFLPKKESTFLRGTIFSWKHKTLYKLIFLMVKWKSGFWSKKWSLTCKNRWTLTKKSESLIKRGSIYDHFYMGGSAWGATWDLFFRKMFGFGEKWVPKLLKIYEKWSEMNLESTIWDETRWKRSQIVWLSLLDQFWTTSSEEKIQK